MTQETIAAFGEQWQRYDHTGRSLEEEFLQDVLGPVILLPEIRGLSVADVGAGNGRFTAVLAKYASQVLSVEPATQAMVNNRARNSHFKNVQFLENKAEDLISGFDADLVFSIGVLHHIPDMNKALSGMIKLLKPHGKLILWVYGREGNGLYIFGMKLLKIFTTWIPDAWLASLSRLFVGPMKAYTQLCKKNLYLPMADYFNKHIAHLTDHEIELIIFDQLNPVTAYYLTRLDLEKLLTAQGFKDLKFYHRHKYSWTVMAGRAG